jgi:hypothetical protein
MDMIHVKSLQGGMYFGAKAPCGDQWTGMRHSDDVRIIIDRALDHVDKCERCKDADSVY